ncbi:hypothetical protein D4764_15G0001410 [Takifugu flavidus]|uniref:Uncharacterized protein n=1 Tax=Takifugu flavidus TaxID=433684 RepID=A0A5C6P3S5_9TELE|nr:hypothetical protein D4764_15G0001410 [Takifugu flavidus]
MAMFRCRKLSAEMMEKRISSPALFPLPSDGLPSSSLLSSILVFSQQQHDSAPQFGLVSQRWPPQGLDGVLRGGRSRLKSENKLADLKRVQGRKTLLMVREEESDHQGVQKKEAGDP